MPAEDVRLPERQESPHITKQDNRKKRKKECGWSLRPREGSSEGGKVPTAEQVWGDQTRLDRAALPSCNPQPETLFCPWWWGLGAEAQVSEGGPRERTGIG